MQNEADLKRWNEIESIIDEHFDLEGDAPTTAGMRRGEGESPLRQRLGAFLQAPAAESPIDRPLESRFGGLLGEAVEARQALGLQSGEEVGPYRIEEVIGEGGMGTVFRARRVDGSFEQEVALKLLHRSPADEDAHRRFLQERQILAGLRHPNIARLLDGGVVRRMPYLVMECIHGLPVVEFSDRWKLGREERIRLLLQACDAVRYAHRQGVIHRDLKPSNLLVEEGPNGEAKISVLDFGIALIEHADLQVTSTGQVFGTPGYMSPEQAFGSRAEIDRRSDVYSLGVVLYELLCGRKPFEGSGAKEVLHQLMEGEPTPLRDWLPNVSLDLETITMTCLAREPARRYDSVRAFAEDLESYLDGGPITARPEGWTGRLLRRARQRPKTAALLTGAVFMTLASLVLLALMAVRYTHDLEVERNAAVEARRDAEGLLDFMLEDLHNGLEKVGRLDLLEQVAQKTLEYSARRATGSEVEEVRGRAAALHNAGKILESQGDLERALEAFNQNRRVFEELLLNDPAPHWQLDLAQSHLGLASSFEARGDAVQTLENARQALALSRPLAARNPGIKGWAEQHFSALAMTGWASREMGLEKEALRVLEEARDFATEMAATNKVQKPEDALAWHHRRAVALSYLGLVHYQEGNFEAALASFEPARDQCEELVAQDPANTSLREEYQLVLSRISFAFFDSGDLQAAASSLQEAQKQAEILVQFEPSNVDWTRELAVTYSTLAAVRRETGDLEGALREIKKSLEITRATIRRFPEKHSAGNDLAWDLLDLGRIQQGLGDQQRANLAWFEAVEVMQAIRRKVGESSYYLDTEVQALLELGRLEEARPLVQRLHQAGWNAPDFLELCARFGLEAKDLRDISSN